MATATVSSGVAVTDSDDPYIPAEQVAAHYPVPCHRATGWRHMMRGCRRGDGRIIRLRSVLIGRRRYVRASWIEEFIAALNADSPKEQSTGRRAKQAGEALAAAGF